MKLLLSTSNIMSGGPSVRRNPNSKSNAELISSLRANFAEHLGWTSEHTHENGQQTEAGYKQWTRQSEDVLEVPILELESYALEEEREQYDITLKLFYLPGAAVEKRAEHTREALSMVMKALKASSVDLLIVSFPGIYFDEQEDCPDKLATRGPVEAEPEEVETQIELWHALEKLHDEGLVRKLGLAEFGKDRLQSFLDRARIRPSVDQINLRDCCSVPRDLMALAKSEQVELLVHNDCSNILPRGTTRELLGSGKQGAGVLAEPSKTGDKRKSLHGEEVANSSPTGGLHGDIQPLWVVKYTAVVKDRGVVENKGYFAAAELSE